MGKLGTRRVYWWALEDVGLALWTLLELQFALYRLRFARVDGEKVRSAKLRENLVLVSVHGIVLLPEPLLVVPGRLLVVPEPLLVVVEPLGFAALYT